ncbi:MAG: hypothetical protein HY078_01100 [Elusimicrobia bacterium]|nr:hypothetical protein [Elusimicrobiota bacterium]
MTSLIAFGLLLFGLGAPAYAATAAQECRAEARKKTKQSLEELKKQRAAALRALRSSPGWKALPADEQEAQVQAIKDNFKALERVIRAEGKAKEKACSADGDGSPLGEEPTIEINLSDGDGGN